MKEIKAFEATDGEKFFTEAECLTHEATSKYTKYKDWYSVHTEFDCTAGFMLRWLTDNAEDIRGFLPPVVAATELDIEVLRKQSFDTEYGFIVSLINVRKWLAGELK
jgi:hypothetical protein